MTLGSFTPSLRIGFVAISLLIAGLGCKTYTGKEKTDFVEEKVVDENVVLDDLSFKALTPPRAEKARLEIQMSWDFQREYHMQKTFRVFREYYPYDPTWEILEVLSAPFLFLTVLPTGLLVAPVELIAGG
ncbi:MAG: hypothetical protein ACYTFG_17560, partial [Planctomycetota bacterium]